MTTTRSTLPAGISLKLPSNPDSHLDGLRLVYRGDVLLGKVWRGSATKSGDWDAWRGAIVNSEHPVGGDISDSTRTNAVLGVVWLYDRKYPS